MKRDAEASADPAKAPRPRGRPPAASKGHSGGAARKRKASASEAPAAKKSRGAGGESDEEDETLADAGARDAVKPAGETVLPAEAFSGAETKPEGAAKRVISDPARAPVREGPPPPVFVVRGQYRTADEVTRDAAKAVREAEAAALAAERAAEEAENREREAWEAERLASELLDEAERQKRAADAEGGVEGRDGRPASRAMWAA